MIETQKTQGEFVIDLLTRCMKYRMFCFRGDKLTNFPISMLLSINLAFSLFDLNALNLSPGVIIDFVINRIEKQAEIHYYI